MKKFLTCFLIFSTSLFTGCSSNEYINSKLPSIKNYSYDTISPIFSGLWVRNDGDSNTYFKIRQDSIEFQSSDKFYNYYDIVTGIMLSDTENNFYLSTIDSCDYDKNAKTTNLHVEIIDNDTIKLEGEVLHRVHDIKKAVNELAPIFELNCSSNPEYNLEVFLEITSDQLKINLENKA